jgi:Tfp pilus assembly protein PilN
MLKDFVQHITQGSIFAGLEINKSRNGDSFHFIELKKTKSELLITNSLTLQNLEEIKGHLKKTTPLFLCINNESVLTKELTNTIKSGDTALVNDAFPNLDIKNFYWELIQKSAHTIVSISRKNSIDALISELKGYNLHPFQFSLGVTSLKNVIPFMDQGHINLYSQQLKIDETNLVEIKQLETSKEQFYSLNGLDISNYNLLVFGQILGYINSNERFNNYTDKNIFSTNYIKNERFFQILSKASLVFFGILLLTNFLFYYHYFDKVNLLTTNLMDNNSQKENVVLLENVVRKKQERSETISNVSNSKTTYFMDQLAQTIPETILLSNINYQPLLKSIRDNKPILLEKQVVLVSGISKDISEFSKWVEELERLRWIVSTETLDYDFVSDTTSDFLIEIKIDDK